MALRLALFSFVVLAVIFEVKGHGRLRTPPARGTIWREPEFADQHPIPNYNDNELNCGGQAVQYEQNGGKCGECGDNWATPRPRPNEGGGEFDKRIIVANYTSGQEIDIWIELTANHLGHFEFRLCEHNNPGTPEEQSCLDKHLLEVVNPANPGTTKVRVFDKVNNYNFKVKLPQGVTCTQCVLQWHYRAGNNWGTCEDGTGAIGCGQQEVFRGCADIGIY